jgi:hypothetical protein
MERGPSRESLGMQGRGVMVVIHVKLYWDKNDEQVPEQSHFRSLTFYKHNCVYKFKGKFDIISPPLPPLFFGDNYCTVIS